MTEARHEWEEGFIWDFTGYTSISRMQIYTDDYFSVFKMVPSAWRLAASNISYMVRVLLELPVRAESVDNDETPVLLRSYCWIWMAFEISHSSSRRMFIPWRWRHIWHGLHSCFVLSFVLLPPVVMQDQHNYSPAVALTFLRFASTRTRRPLPIPHHIPEWAKYDLG